MSGPDFIVGLRALAADDPELLLSTIYASDAYSEEFGTKLDALCNEMNTKGLNHITCCALMAAAAGYAIGDGVRAERPQAGLVTDASIEVLVRLLRYSAEQGFAQNLKEAVHGRND